MTNTLGMMIGLAVLAGTAYGQIEMRPRPTDEKDYPEYIEYLVEVADPRSDEERTHDVEMMEKYKDAFNLDSLFVGGPGFPAGFSPEMYDEFIAHSMKSRFAGVSATISNGGEGAKAVFERIRNLNQYWSDRPETFVQVFSSADLSKAKQTGRLGIHHNFQSMDAIDEDVSNIEKFYKLGVRQMNFTYNVDNAFSSGCASNSNGKDEGLTELGRQAVREMNRLGMVVDCSHSSNQTAIDAATLSTKPVILSHSNVATFQPIDRNTSDDAFRVVAATNGLICINFIGGFLNPQGDATPYSIAKHAEYLKNLVGAEHVGAGSDYVWNYGDSLMMILKNPKKYPPEMGYASPSHMGKPGEVWGVVRELEETFGWTEDEVRGFLGGNVLRVYEANWVKQ